MNEVRIPDKLSHLNEIRINYWFAEEGDRVEVDDSLVELSTDDGPYLLLAEKTGIIEEIIHQSQDVVCAGDVVAYIAGEAERGGNSMLRENDNEE